MESSKKIDVAIKMLENVQSLIKFSDTKINVLLVISGITTTYVLGTYNGKILTYGCLSIILILFYVFFFLFLFFSIQTIAPRKANHTGNSVSRVIYFKHVAERNNANDYFEDLKKTNEDGFLKDFVYQIFENSKIAEKKFENYNNSLMMLKLQVLFFLVLLVAKNI